MGLDSILRQVYITKGISDALAFGAGIARGYCSAQGIDITPEILEKSILFGPLAIQTVAGGYSGLIDGIIDVTNKNYTPSAIKGGALGLVLGVTEMGIGFCIGYTMGGLSK